MLKRPSARRKSRGTEEVDLPLVPIMDAFVVLIAFLLLATSMLAVTLIDTPLPVLSSMRDDSKDKPLMLTLRIEQEGLKLESPFNRIKPQSFPKIEKGYDLEKFHEALIAIKQSFPTEKTIVFSPKGDVKYNDIVQLMDASRMLEKTDPPFYTTDENGVSRAESFLFPNVVFDNVITGG